MAEKKLELSKRETAVLKLIASGTFDQEISEELSVSIRTVKSTVEGLNVKFLTRNRPHLVAEASAQGYLK